MQPTILTNTNPDMKVVREEIFGPVVCAIPFDSPEEIIPTANDTNYGLAAGVFTRDISKAHRTAKRLRAGTVWINTYHVFDAAMPFGGYKESGWGRRWAPGPQQLPRDEVRRHGPVVRDRTTNGDHPSGSRNQLEPDGGQPGAVPVQCRWPIPAARGAGIAMRFWRHSEPGLPRWARCRGGSTGLASGLTRPGAPNAGG